jgi:outer membrane lipoprotein LolB
MSNAARFIANRYVFLTLCCAALTGCVTPQLGVPTRDAAELSEWQAKGRIAVAGPEGGGSGSFTWRQDSMRANVDMRGPIGIGALRLTLSDTELRIATGDGQEFEAAAAQDELTARLGASVPTIELRYWLVGIAAPGEHSWSNGAAEGTAVLSQRDWRIEYQRYAIESGYKLPTRLVATSGPARVRIVIDGWRLTK